MIGSRTIMATAGAGALIVWLLYATGGLVYLYAVAQVLFAANDMQRGIREAEALGRANPKFAPGLQVEGADQGDEKKPGYVALSYGDKLNDNRTVSVQSAVRLTDLLKEGESLPDAALLEAFATARAAKLADAECRLLEQKLARKCVVQNSTGSARDGVATIGMTLAFIQAQPFGALPAGPRAAYVETTEQLYGGRSRRMGLDAAAEARADAYGEIAELCEKLRASEGNCAISGVSVGGYPDASGSAVEFTARAQLSSLTALPG